MLGRRVVSGRPDGRPVGAQRRDADRRRTAFTARVATRRRQGLPPVAALERCRRAGAGTGGRRPRTALRYSRRRLRLPRSHSATSARTASCWAARLSRGSTHGQWAARGVGHRSLPRRGRCRGRRGRGADVDDGSPTPRPGRGPTPFVPYDRRRPPLGRGDGAASGSLAARAGDPAAAVARGIDDPGDAVGHRVGGLRAPALRARSRHPLCLRRAGSARDRAGPGPRTGGRRGDSGRRRRSRLVGVHRGQPLRRRGKADRTVEVADPDPRCPAVVRAGRLPRPLTPGRGTTRRTSRARPPPTAPAASPVATTTPPCSASTPRPRRPTDWASRRDQS